jgi:hypothetical protein
MAKHCKHWTVLQAEEANRTPMWARPFCHKHGQFCIWTGSWTCAACMQNRPPVERRQERRTP